MATKRAADLVSEAKQHIENLSPEQVAQEREEGTARIIDIRESEERQQHGAIPGALHAPRGMLEFHADPSTPYYRPEFDPNARIILYCASSGRSALATKTLQDMGFTNVAHLDGGLNAWKAADLPVETPSGS